MINFNDLPGDIKSIIYKINSEVEKNIYLKKMIIEEFKSTFGKHDEIDMQYPFWFKKECGDWPWFYYSEIEIYGIEIYGTNNQ